MAVMMSWVYGVSGWKQVENGGGRGRPDPGPKTQDPTEAAGPDWQTTETGPLVPKSKAGHLSRTQGDATGGVSG